MLYCIDAPRIGAVSSSISSPFADRSTSAHPRSLFELVLVIPVKNFSRSRTRFHWIETVSAWTASRQKAAPAPLSPTQGRTTGHPRYPPGLIGASGRGSAVARFLDIARESAVMQRTPSDR